jgi:hypothetical protein
MVSTGVKFRKYISYPKHFQHYTMNTVDMTPTLEVPTAIMEGKN